MDDQEIADMFDACDEEITRLGTELARAKTLLRYARAYVLDAYGYPGTAQYASDLLQDIDKLLSE